jgi:hypothetical protein
MATLVMDRRAADNKYLHRDFHISTDTGLRYLGTHYGDAAVQEFLKQFVRAWYAPLAEAVRREGLGALQRHIKEIFEIEEAADSVHTLLEEGELRVLEEKNPALSYMRSTGYEPSPWYGELTVAVNRYIAEMAGIGFEFQTYDQETGKAAYRFFCLGGTGDFTQRGK